MWKCPEGGTPRISSWAWQLAWQMSVISGMAHCAAKQGEGGILKDLTRETGNMLPLQFSGREETTERDKQSKLEQSQAISVNSQPLSQQPGCALNTHLMKLISW